MPTKITGYMVHNTLPWQHHCRRGGSNILICCQGNRLYSRCYQWICFFAV